MIGTTITNSQTTSGITTPNTRLEIQPSNTTVGTYAQTYEPLTINKNITPNHPNMEKQIKVAVFITETEDNKIISSKFLKEGWIRKPHTNANLNLLAVKEFKIPLDDLDKIYVKEILAINLESVVAAVGLFIDNVLVDMKNVSKSTTKPVILAHIEAWKNELETIKQFTKT
jgi:hypothetical protein